MGRRRGGGAWGVVHWPPRLRGRTPGRGLRNNGLDVEEEIVRVRDVRVGIFGTVGVGRGVAGAALQFAENCVD